MQRDASSLTTYDGNRYLSLIAIMSVGFLYCDRLRRREPSQGAFVQVMTEGYPRGVRQLVPVSAASTNLKGEYQVSGLQPGKYYVQLQGTGQAMGVEPGNEDQGFRRQFYGGATDWKRAAPVVAASGQQIRGVDFRAIPTHAVRVTGHVTGAPEWHPPQPDSSGTVTIGGAEGPIFVSISLQAVGEEVQWAGHAGGAGPPEYKFEIGGVIPGHYKLMASAREPDGRMLYSRQLIEVGEQPGDLEVTLAPTVDLKGTVRYEGDPAQRPGAFQVDLVSGEQNGMTMPPAPAKVNPDGTFTITGVAPGIWDINPGPIPKGGFLKSMRLGAQDVLAEDMEIGPATNAPLNIVISSRGGKVEGELDGEAARRKPAAIMLAPLGKFAAVMSFFALTESDAEGKFQLTGLNPGKYRLFAFERTPQGDFRGPDMVKKMTALGEPVEVVEGETKQVRVKPITPEQLQEVLQ